MYLYTLLISSVGIGLVSASPLVARDDWASEALETVTGIENPNKNQGDACVVSSAQGGNPLRGKALYPRDCSALSVWKNSFEEDRSARLTDLYSYQNAFQNQLQCCLTIPCLPAINQRAYCINAQTKSCSSGKSIPGPDSCGGADATICCVQNSATSLVGDGANEIALGDQDSNSLNLGISPGGVDTPIPGAEAFALDGSTSALDGLSFPPSSDGLSFLPSSDGSAANLFSSVPQIDQTAGSDTALLPSTGAQDQNDILAFNPGPGDISNPEGLSFAMAPETDGSGDAGSYSNLDGGSNDGILASLSGPNTGDFQDWTA